MTAFTGAIANLNAGDEVLDANIDTWHDSLVATNDPWTSFTPTWTSTGTAPVLGNGTLTGRYRQNGKTVDVVIVLTWGSTTTGGTATWIISLPVAGKDANQILPCYLKDANVDANRRAGVCPFNTTSNVTLYPGSGGVVTATTPFTWQVSDVVIIEGTYEAA